MHQRYWEAGMGRWGCWGAGVRGAVREERDQGVALCGGQGGLCMQLGGRGGGRGQKGPLCVGPQDHPALAS